MIFYSKKLLMADAKVYYTLTVVTDPVSATCTLTYNGLSYTTKSATVEAGTVISYSVYHATYGTTTGTITMDSDKTLTCNGTYSTSYTDGNSWASPTNMTSNTSADFELTPSGEYSSAGGYRQGAQRGYHPFPRLRLFRAAYA